MDDLISRQAAIEAVSEGCQEWRGIFERCEENLLALPSAQPEPSEVARDIATIIENEKDMRVIASEPQWIPCSERLPEEYGEFLITWLTAKAPKKRFIGFAEGEPDGEWDEQRNRFKFNWHPDDYIMENYPDWRIAAWMPLPSPYKGEQE